MMLSFVLSFVLSDGKEDGKERQEIFETPQCITFFAGVFSPIYAGNCSIIRYVQCWLFLQATYHFVESCVNYLIF